MAQRFTFQMTLEAGNLRFGRHLRQVKTIFRNTDRADPVGKIVHHDPVGTFDPFARITIFHLFAGHIQRIALHLNFRIGQQDGILRLWLIFRAGVVVIVWPQIVEVSPQRDPKHKGVPALIAEVNVGPIGDAINSADVKLALLIQLARKILLVIVSLILQFQTKRLPGRLILDAAKQ